VSVTFVGAADALTEKVRGWSAPPWGIASGAGETVTPSGSPLTCTLIAGGGTGTAPIGGAGPLQGAGAHAPTATASDDPWLIQRLEGMAHTRKPELDAGGSGLGLGCEVGAPPQEI
jgi:hypothetical protein